MNCRPRLLLLGWLLVSLQAAAEEEAGDPPSLDLLEFLGRWETASGERIDPTELEDAGLLRQLGMEENRKGDD